MVDENKLCLACNGCGVVHVHAYGQYQGTVPCERCGLNVNKPEPDPVPNGSRPIWELVIADMQERDGEGRRKYGTPLQAHNGRDALVDAYQEALDLVVYLRQAIEERGQCR